MHSILASSLLITLCGSANAATVHHAHRRHAIVRPNQGTNALDPASGFAYAPPGPPIHHRPAPYNDYNEPYPAASQGYSPGERSRFLDLALATLSVTKCNYRAKRRNSLVLNRIAERWYRDAR